MLGGDPTLESALSRLLSAYQLFDGERMGYFQGQAFIASTLLAQLQDEVDSFWVFTHLMEVYFLSAADLASNPSPPVDQLLQGDFDLLHQQVDTLLPRLAAYFRHLRLPVGVFARAWFSALFCQTFPPRQLPKFFDRLLGFVFRCCALAMMLVWLYRPVCFLQRFAILCE
jgi:Rab-GTPase-TBC domain